MKKIVLVVSSFLLIAGLSFGQTPQTQDKTTKAAPKTEATKTTEVKKDSKDCSKSCSDMKKSTSCCAHDKSGAKKDEKAPEKK